MPEMTRMSDRSDQSSVRRASGAARSVALLLLLVPLTPGCLGARGNVELLEARLREREDLINRQEHNLSDARADLAAARQEADLLRKQIADGGASPLPPEYAGTLFRVEDIQFNTLMTGGRDQDGTPGDELLVVVFAPYDEHGDVVKLPGRIDLEAIDPTRTEEEGREIAQWTFTPEESRDLWRSSWFTAGFELRVAWPEPPQAEQVLLHARLSTADGRHFDATHTIAIHPAGNHDDSPGTFPTPEVVRPVTFDSTSPSPGEESELHRLPVWSDSVTPLEDFLDMGDHSDDSRQPRPDDEPLLHIEEGAAVEDPAALDSDSAASPAADDGPADADSTGARDPRPFPEGLRTSDVWTDETIPRLR